MWNYIWGKVRNSMKAVWLLAYLYITVILILLLLSNFSCFRQYNVQLICLQHMVLCMFQLIH